MTQTKLWNLQRGKQLMGRWAHHRNFQMGNLLCYNIYESYVEFFLGFHIIMELLPSPLQQGDYFSFLQIMAQELRWFIFSGGFYQSYFAVRESELSLALVVFV